MKRIDFKWLGDRRPRAKERGQVTLLTVILLVMIVILAVTNYAGSGSTENNRNTADNSAQLALVKTALLAYAANGRNPGPAACGVNTNWRPGELPCPDLDNDGVEECLCTGSQRMGRVPWKTLGIAEPKDAAGETLWYAISTHFRAYNAYAGPVAINSDTKGSLAVWKDDMVSNLTTEAVAVLIAPGPAVSTQKRAAGVNEACTQTGTTIAQNRCPNNYMETTSGGGQNWHNNGPFVMTLATPAPEKFNDQVLAITTADIIPPIEQRVAKDVVALLKDYKRYSACTCFPWADSDWDGSSNASALYGNPPLVTALPEAWGSGTIPAMTSYLTTNNWWRVLFYAVGDRITAAPSAYMVLDLNGGGGNTSAVLITPGPAGATRPSTNWADYIADSANRDGDINFITPSSTAYSRNRLSSIAYPYP